MTLTDGGLDSDDDFCSGSLVETSVNVTTNSPSQEYTHLDDHNLPTYDMTMTAGEAGWPSG